MKKAKAKTTAAPAPAPAAQSHYLSALHGAQVYSADNHPVGHLRDLAVVMKGNDYPQISGVIIRNKGENVFAPLKAVSEIKPGGVRLKKAEIPFEAFDETGHQVLIYRHLIDRQVVDPAGLRVARINDIAVSADIGRPAVLGIDLGFKGLLRRLVPRRLAASVRGDFTDWKSLEPLASDIPEVNTYFAHKQLALLHPSDIGRLLDQLPQAQGAELIASLDTGQAADALEEADHDHQLGIVEHLDEKRAVEVLNEMAPDAAADVLAHLPRKDTDALLKGMDKEAAAEIRLLLSYPEDTAGGLMTTDFVIALEGDTTKKAIARLRREAERPDLIYYVYVVNSAKTRELRGVISLRDLLLNDEDTPVSSYMVTDMQTVQPDAPAKDVARIIGEYNLLALPVTDKVGGLLGLVTVDDVVDILLPADVRHHMPRLFS